MMTKRHFLALQQLSGILSKALADCSVVFGELATNEEGTTLAPAAAAVAAPALAPVAPAPAVVAAAPPAPPPPAPPAEPTGPDLQPLETVAVQLKISPATIYNSIKKGLIKKHNPFGGRANFILVSEVKGLIDSGLIRRSTPAGTGMLTALEAAATLKISSQSFYSLIANGEFKDYIRQGKRILIRRTALDDYMRSKGLLPPLPVEEPKVEEGPSAQERITASLLSLKDEVNELEQYLSNMAPGHRSSQIATWAGQMRKLAEDMMNVPPIPRAELRTSVWSFIDRLRCLADQYDLFVNALIFEWEIEDWDLYIRSVSTTPPAFSKEELEVIHEGNLRAIMMRARNVKIEVAKKIIDDAKAALPADNAVLVKAERSFRSKLQALDPLPVADAEEIVEPSETVSARALSLTTGKRVIIVGGQGERSAHAEQYMKQLRFASVDWITHERNKSASVGRIASRLSLKNYDLMLYLASYSGHSTGDSTLPTARKNKLPVVMINRGYSVSSIARAIEEQYTPAPIIPITRARKPATKSGAKRVAHARA